MFNWFTQWLEDQRTYRKLVPIKQAVDARIHYTDRGTKDRIYVPRGTKAEGDCEMLAETYVVDCCSVGLDAVYHVYKLSNGQYHAVCVCGNWILDCRVPLPVKA